MKHRKPFSNSSWVTSTRVRAKSGVPSAHMQAVTMDTGLLPGQTVTVLEKLPFDGPIRVRVGADEHLFGRPLAARINVTTRPRAKGNR